MNETGISPKPVAGSAELSMMPPPIAPEKYLSAAQWGMVAFLVSEAAVFCTLIAVYVAYMGVDAQLIRDGVGVGPTPAEALSLPLVLCTTVCLLSSSFTIHLAEKALKRGEQSAFCLWWALTIALGVIFLAGTLYEWSEMMGKHHLTISRNLFGTTYYTLVGFHGLHVTGGVVLMSILLGLAVRRAVTVKNHAGVELVSWYWHFVDGVWVVVFTLVYLVSR